MKNISFYREGIQPGWTLESRSYRPESAAEEETLFTLSNGYMGIRGAVGADTPYGAPGTYIAGLFDKKETEEKGKDRGFVKDKAITPAYAIVPDGNLAEISSEGGKFDFVSGKVGDYVRMLDMKRGLLFDRYELENAAGRTIRVETLTFVSKVSRHLAFRRTEITPVDFDGEICVRLKNSLCPYPQTIRRLRDYICPTALIASEAREECVLRARVGTGTEVSLLAKTEGAGRRYAEKTKTGADEVFFFFGRRGETAAFEKRWAYYTSRDGVPETLSTQTGEGLLSEHAAFWEDAWQNADVETEGDDEVQTGLRWNLFSLMQVACPGNSDVSISATGLHGQGYFGHAFWDTEIFMLPFYLAACPEEAKSLLLYRCKRLDAAREIAAAEGCEGAKFPWTSAYTGNDVTPPDWAASSKREIHISGAVAYALHNYAEQTGDCGFYKDYGIETVVETAKYYASRASAGKDGKYHIADVTGPDEYNIHVTDNYYTNYLAVWNMREAVAAMRGLREEDPACFRRIAAATGYGEETEEKLKRTADNMAFPPVREGVYEQFDGFFRLKDAGEPERDEYGMPKDRTRVFDSGVQELKQPDVVMMFYLFPDDFPRETQRASFDYYEKRCKHGSSLSPSVHCVVGLRNGMKKHAYGYFRLTSLLDPKNLHHDKNLAEGVHIACAGGTWCAAVYGFGGLRIADGKAHIDPDLPERLSRLAYSFLLRGTRYRVEVCREGFTVRADRDAEIFVGGKKAELKAGEPRSFGG